MPGIDIKSAEDLLTERIIGAAIEVHRHLGPGLLESVYQGALEQELLARGMAFASEVHLPVWYKGTAISGAFRVDLVVEQDVVVEMKAIDAILPVHCAQLLTYLRLGGFARGLLINFNVNMLAHGVRRFVR